MLCHLRSDESLKGKEGANVPLLNEFLETANEAEIESHFWTISSFRAVLVVTVV